MRRSRIRRRAFDYAAGAGVVAITGILGWQISNRTPSTVSARPRDVLRNARLVSDDGQTRLIALETTRGTTEARHYPAPGARRGVIWLSGATREWRTPAAGLYPRLAADLVSSDVTSLWLRYRDPANFNAAVLEATAAIGFLEREGVHSIAVTGHSMGGAVAVRAALASSRVRTVIALATQADGTGGVAQLAPRCALLVVHGERDRVLPPANAAVVYHAAANPKHLVLYPEATHTLDEAAGELTTLVRDWLLDHLR